MRLLVVTINYLIQYGLFAFKKMLHHHSLNLSVLVQTHAYPRRQQPPDESSRGQTVRLSLLVYAQSVRGLVRPERTHYLSYTSRHLTVTRPVSKALTCGVKEQD